MNNITLAVATAAVLIASTAQAAPTPLDICVGEVQAAHPGKMKSLSSEIEDGKSQFEIDILGRDGKHWEVECNAATGKINRIEGELPPGSPEFRQRAKVPLNAAIKAANDKYPGAIINTEYDIEKDGEISYEFIIKTDAGKMIEIEVDAETGKLAGEEEVLYHIGD